MAKFPQIKFELNLDGDSRRDEVDKFTVKYYKRHKLILEKRVTQFEKGWKKVEKHFFEATTSVFGSFPWPKGKYICFISIFDSNPRFLENKTFQLYYRYPQWGNHIIAHEMLHFIFFDYLDNQEKEFKEKLDEGTTWLLSELFNDKILELPQFDGFRSKDGGAYPEVMEFAKKFENRIDGKMDIKNFLQQAKTV